MIEQKDEIQKVAYSLFSQFGIKSVTMDDISKELGISKKTLYKYFSNKKELVFEITQSKIIDSETQCRSYCCNSIDPIHEIIMLMGFIKKTFQNTNLAMMYDMQKYHKDSWKLMEKHKSVFIFNMIIDNLKRGIKAEVYRESLKIDILAKMRLGVMRMSFTPEFNPNNKYSMEEIQLELLNHFLMGITTKEGYKLAEKYKKKINRDEN